MDLTGRWQFKAINSSLSQAACSHSDAGELVQSSRNSFWPFFAYSEKNILLISLNKKKNYFKEKLFNVSEFFFFFYF